MFLTPVLKCAIWEMPGSGDVHLELTVGRDTNEQSSCSLLSHRFHCAGAHHCSQGLACETMVEARRSRVPHAASGLDPEGGVSRPSGYFDLRSRRGNPRPRSRLDGICLGRHGITADIALRLGKFFNVDPQWFTRMQAKHDLHLRGARC